MKRYKKLYIVSLILIAVVITSVYFSYAFFANKNEQHGKLNVVVGDLKYELTSSDLVDNSITILPGEEKELTITLTSLNSISSKYEIYYNLSNGNNVEVGYTNTPASGTIGANEVINIEVGIKNKGTSSTIVTFGLEKGLTNNQIVLNDGNSLNEIEICRYNQGTTWNFAYTGGEQEFTVPCDGMYKVEVWGAQGGAAVWNSEDVITYLGGYGGYSVGNVNFNKGTELYINVGGQGQTCDGICQGGYNGGGAASGRPSSQGIYEASSGTGGGATHIATSSGILAELESNKNSILIVAGGGGGSFIHRYNDANNYWNGYGGAAGGFKSVSGFIPIPGRSNPPTSATQTTAGTGYNVSNIFGQGSFGQGQNGLNSDGAAVDAAGGGGGYYGGGSSRFTSTSGGSGYIGNTILTDKAMYCYNCESSDDSSMKTVSTTCHSSSPEDNCAKEGNGYARITLVSLD